MSSIGAYRPVLCAGLAALGIHGCGGSYPAPQTRGTAPPATPLESQTTASAASVGVTSRQAPEPSYSNLDDGHIAAVVEAIDDAEIRIAQMADGLATDPEVKRFAHEMLIAYEGRLSQDKQRWSENGVTPIAGPVTGTLDAETQEEATTLANMEGPAFDREYIDTEVRHLDRALDLLGQIIGTTNSELKGDLITVHREIEEHLGEAKSVRERMGNPSE